MGEVADVWTAGALQHAGYPGALAALLSSALGCVPVGPASPVRLLLASPHDAGLGACALGALLRAAGHEQWAVCEVW